MSLLSGVSEFFGLDLGTSAICAVQLTNNPSSKQLLRYGMMPIDAKVTLSDSKAYQQKLASMLKELLATAQITTKNVAVGIPSARVFTTVIDIERLSPAELAKTIA